MNAIQERLLAEADLSEKGLDFMGDEELREETRENIALLRAAASRLERLEVIWDIVLVGTQRIHALEDEMANARGWDLDDRVGQRKHIGDHERSLGQRLSKVMRHSLPERDA